MAHIEALPISGIEKDSKFSHEEIIYLQGIADGWKAEDFRMKSDLKHGAIREVIRNLLSERFSQEDRYDGIRRALYIAVQQGLIDTGEITNKITGSDLRPQEIKILAWMSLGITKNVIIKELEIKEVTFNTYMQDIRKKLEASTTMQTVAFGAIAFKRAQSDNHTPFSQN